MADFSRDAVTGRLALSLVEFARLDEELREARWQHGAGVIDEARFRVVCGELDARLDTIDVFLERFRANAGQYRALEKIVDGQLAARARTACRTALQPLAQWFGKIEEPTFVFADPGFHVRAELLLEVAWEFAERYVREAQTAADTPVARTAEKNSWLNPAQGDSRLAAARKTWRTLSALEGLTEGKNLPGQEWQALREKRRQIEETLGADRPEEALWQALDLQRWTEEIVQKNRPLDFPVRAPGADREFCESAARLAAMLSQAVRRGEPAEGPL